MEFDIYGRIREDTFNNKSFIPFRQLGQYEDVKTGLYYNRFRYYDSESGCYISSDPYFYCRGLKYLRLRERSQYLD
ncbi:RHS repeat-associated core domain-containing protein [uncultured Gilliamella sp.]|uniref:RHS repeat-associated core domain-containing protein n=1 Tax=uncultured Gilliamella sp. TaxID=1193505 RepID=UPI0025F38B1C|nr:RHS repeat-associated core domain-containing protein [uncultured Gilliamella sp.]